MTHRRAGRWSADVEKGTASSSSSDKRNAPSHFAAMVSAGRRGLRRGGKAWNTDSRLVLFKFTLGIVVVLVLAIRLVFPMGDQSFSPAANSCQVDRDAKERLSQLMKEGRRRDSESSFPADWEPVLPKIIHHQWKTKDIPPKFKAWHQKWFELYPEPEYTHMLWTDEAARDLIKEHYSWFLDTYDNYNFGIKRADATRYFYLHHHGGLHADLDYEPLTNFYDALPQDRVGVVESPYRYKEETQNSLMSSPRGDPFWLDVFAVLQNNKDNKSTLAATGPVLLDTARRNSQHPVYILPCENFQRIPFAEKGGWQRRFYPMKQCGDYENDYCQFAKHHNTAVYDKATKK